MKIVISTGGGIVENSECRDILKNLKNYVVFIDRNPEELMKVNSIEKPIFHGKTIEEVYKSRLSYYKICSIRFSPPSYALMSEIYNTEEEYLERLKEIFFRIINKKWISVGSSKVPFPPSDSFFACTDMDLK